MLEIRELLRYLKQRESERAISRALGLSRNTVKKYREWPQLFGDPLLASAGLDRLFHNAHVLVITGPSFRAQGRHKELAAPLEEATPAPPALSS